MSQVAPTCQAAWDDDVVVPRDLSVRAQLDAILQEYDAADQRLRRAAVMGDHDGAEQADRERLEALASKIESHRAIADLLLLLVRVAIGTDRGAALGLYLGEVLAPALRPIAEAVATLETHCSRARTEVPTVTIMDEAAEPLPGTDTLARTPSQAGHVERGPSHHTCRSRSVPLPAPLAEYVRQCAVALGCDPAFVALPVLAVIASAIGNTRVIRLKRGWDEPAVLWTVIVGDSGTLKSPAYRKAVGLPVPSAKAIASGA